MTTPAAVHPPSSRSISYFDAALADYARATDLRVAPHKGLAVLYRKSIDEAPR